jgi:hypothetical protein
MDEILVENYHLLVPGAKIKKMIPVRRKTGKHYLFPINRAD